jgi:Protein of unknown function (DUF3592)
VAVRFGRSPRIRLLATLLIPSAFLLSFVWDSLSTHARGMILAAYGVIILGFALVPELRTTRELLKRGAQTQGTVVGAEEETGDRSTTYHPVVRFTTADGRPVTFTADVGFGLRPKIGGVVPVRYRREDPEQAEIDRAYTWMVPAAAWLLLGLGLLVNAVNVYTDEPQVAPAAESQVAPAAEESQVAPTVVDSPDDSGTGEPVPMGPPAKVATGRIGDRLTVVDHSGRAQLEITVTRLKFSRGDQVLQPEHGWHMGVHLEAHALADAQELFISALVGGREYSDLWEITWGGFDPLLDPDELSLNKGERVAGWLVLDVPGRHGQLVLHNQWTHKLAVWTY